MISSLIQMRLSIFHVNLSLIRFTRYQAQDKDRIMWKSKFNKKKKRLSLKGFIFIQTHKSF